MFFDVYVFVFLDSRNEIGSVDFGGCYFFVGKFEYYIDFLIGCGIWGYIVYDMKIGKFVFFRDFWCYEMLKLEIKVYE